MRAGRNRPFVVGLGTVVAGVPLTINGQEITAPPGATILEAARSANIYIPALCNHPSLPNPGPLSGAKFVFRGNERIDSDDPQATWDGCGLCAVTVDGGSELVRACATEAQPGMTVVTNSEALIAHRRRKLSVILAEHPHSCLTCAQSEGCSLTQCSSNVPEEERCCAVFGSCELRRVSQFVGVPQDLPKYKPRGLPRFDQEPLYSWNTELCIACLRCVRACGELRDVGTLSFVMQGGRPIVGTTGGPTRAESHCRLCGACVEVCPTGALVDKTRAVGDEREKTLVPCRNACPAGVDIPRFVRHIAQGDHASAIAVIRERLPFSFAPSYVCFHPCEEVCRRGSVNDPIAICQLKRFAADNDAGEWRARQKKLQATGKRVAVVGSGPAGLTAAYYLAKQGHAVTIYEALSRPGGMLRVGIPEYRYPHELLDRDIDEIRSAGVEIRTNSAIADAASFTKLVSDHDAVFVAVGAHESKKIDVPGCNLNDVHWGTEFLRNCALENYHEGQFKGRQVVVIGGGNVAVDAARVVRRLGAADVSVVSLEDERGLPAYDWEVEEAIEEGIRFLTRWGPKEIRGNHGRVSGLILKSCTSVFDERGNFRPAYDEAQKREISADTVILAIGQNPSSMPFESCGLKSDKTIISNQQTLSTAIPKVYAGGDVVSGPKSVIEAIAMGRQAASEIDKSLGGDGDIDETLLDERLPASRLGRIDNFAVLERVAVPKSAPAVRASSFMPIETGFSRESAMQEAARCLACDLRLAMESVILPPRLETAYELNAVAIAGVPESEGVYQLLDAQKQVIAIKGVMNLRSALMEVLEENRKARFFVYEEETMYTKRESELIQQYLQEHGALPGGGDDELDDLF